MIYIISDNNSTLTLIPSTPSFREMAAVYSVRTGMPLISDCTEIWAETGDGSTSHPDRAKAGIKIFVRKPSLDGKNFSKYELDANTSYVILLKTSDAADKLLSFAFIAASSFHAGQTENTDKVYDAKLRFSFNVIPPEKAHETLLYPLELSRDENYVIDVERSQGTGVHVRDAELIFSGGRGIMNEESFGALRKLAAKYGASVGASRPMVDQGWATWDEQIGQTGSIVKPKVYVAFGISGAVQHITGIEKSQNIIAINLNKTSPIFRYADYGAFADDNSIIRNMLNLIEANNNSNIN